MQVDGDARMIRKKFCHHRCDVHQAKAHWRCQPNHALGRSRFVAGSLLGRESFRQNTACPFCQLPTAIGQRKMAGGAVKQAKANLVLKAGDGF